MRFCIQHLLTVEFINRHVGVLKHGRHILRAFALPVGIGLAGGLGGMLLLVKGYGLYFPYSLLCLGMRANNTKLALPVGQFLMTCLLGILVFSFLSIQWIKKRDVTTG